jgi:TolA-binding protein
MKCARGALVLVALLFSFVRLFAQNSPVRRAQPVDQPPVARALPAEDSSPEPRSTSLPNESSEAPAAPTVPPSQRQLEYAEGLFRQKLYDLAAPEFEKYIDQYPAGAERARVHFFLGETYRALNKPGPARKNFQAVLDNFGESDYAGPAAYVLAETAFTEKNYGGALPLFHRAGAKSKEPAVALSARYFEARCLEALDKKDEAAGIYLQVIDAKDPNPYRDDSRVAAASIFLSRGKKLEAFKQYDALANAKAGVESGGSRARWRDRCRSCPERKRQDRQGNHRSNGGVIAKRPRLVGRGKISRDRGCRDVETAISHRPIRAVADGLQKRAGETS